MEIWTNHNRALRGSLPFVAGGSETQLGNPYVYDMLRRTTLLVGGSFEEVSEFHGVLLAEELDQEVDVRLYSF